MDAIVDALAEQNDELAGLLAGLSEEDTRRPSACEGWSIADVVLHLAQTNEMAIASVENRFPAAAAEFADFSGFADARVDTVDDVADLSVAKERGQPWAEVHERWRTSVETLQRVFRAADPHARVTWVAGDMAARTLATTRLAETWIHTGDVADGLGVELAPTDRLAQIARLAWRTLPYAFARDGRELSRPVAFELVGPSGDRWDFGTGAAAPTVIRGPAVELCLVASRRVAPGATTLTGEGPDADAVLALVRTWA